MAHSTEPQGFRPTLTVGGAPEGHDAQLLARLLAERGKPVIHVARDDKRLEEMRLALDFFAPHLPVLVFPAWDCLPYDRVSPNHDVSAARMAVLATLAAGFDRPALILTTVNAATQKVPPREVVAGSSFTATVDVAPPDALTITSFEVDRRRPRVTLSWTAVDAAAYTCDRELVQERGRWVVRAAAAADPIP